MVLNLLDKIQYKNEKNVLIQGLPSSIEKQFAKLSFAKNVTPLLRSRKIDFALIFAINQKQLNQILTEILPALAVGARLWTAYPKKASKIVTDLNKASSWEILDRYDFTIVEEITIDHVWNAYRYKRNSDPEVTKTGEIHEMIVNGSNTATLAVPIEIIENAEAYDAFRMLSDDNQEDFIDWIQQAKKEVTKQKRIKDTIDKLRAGKKSPSEK
jgi:hypothetical protein